MSLVPRSTRVLTPAQYGAVAPSGTSWPLNKDDYTRYAVNKIYSTIQGEGSKAGTAMTIVRLQGCPVGCVFCDTPESWMDPGAFETAPISKRDGSREWVWQTAEGIAHYVAGLPPRWALITGGEPTWHDLSSLTYELLDRGIKRALETSGVYKITGVWSWVTISPKPRGFLTLNPENLELANEIKWLVGKPDDVTGLEKWLAQHEAAMKKRYVPSIISVQPISCSERATDLCVEALMKHPDWRLSLQTHKMMRIA